MIDFKPSDVVLHPATPLCGTFQRTEKEQAIATIVRVCQELGDQWVPVTMEQIADRVEQDVTNTHDFARTILCPLYRPDFLALSKERYVECCSVDGKSAFALTQDTLERLRVWVRR